MKRLAISGLILASGMALGQPRLLVIPSSADAPYQAVINGIQRTAAEYMHLPLAPDLIGMFSAVFE